MLPLACPAVDGDGKKANESRAGGSHRPFTTVFLCVRHGNGKLLLGNVEIIRPRTQASETPPRAPPLRRRPGVYCT